MADFCNKFDGVTACVVTSDEMPYFTLIEGSWENGCCGGVSSLNSPQYYVTIPIGAQVSVQLIVPQKALDVGAIRVSLLKPPPGATPEAVAAGRMKPWLQRQCRIHHDIEDRQSAYMNGRSTSIPKKNRSGPACQSFSTSEDTTRYEADGARVGYVVLPTLGSDEATKSGTVGTFKITIYATGPITVQMR